MPLAPSYRAAPGTDTGIAPLHHADGEVAKFPTLAVIILALGMTVNCYTLVSLFPYVGMMVKELLGLQSTNEAGFYAGYVASAFTFGRFLSGYFWGYLTDSIGRKPVIILGLISMATFSLAFGFSTSYTWAVSSRLILGLTNGIMPALRTSVSEVCGPEHVVVGMTYVSSCKAISMVFGTGIGGLLAQPTVHFPGVFSTTGLFGRYPFLLPNLVGACCALLILVLVVVYLPETKGYGDASKQHTASGQPSSDGNSTGTVATDAADTFPEEALASSPTGTGNTSLNSTNYEPLITTASVNDRGDRINNEGGCLSGGSCSSNDDGHADKTGEMPAICGPRTNAEEEQGHSEEEETPGIFGRNGLLATPHVKYLLLLASIVQAIQIGYDETYPLFALSTPDVGGLGWNTLQIGKVLFVTGVLMAVFQLLLFPPLIKVVGIATCQRLAFLASVPALLVVPAVKMLSWNYPSLFTVSVTANTLANCCVGVVNVALAIGSTTLVSSRMRGKMGGLYNMAESFGRFLGPAGFSITYAWSISPSGSASAIGWVNHYFVFCASAVMMALCAVLAWPTLTAENFMKKWEDDNVAGVGGASSGHSDSIAASFSPVDDSSVHLDDPFVSAAAVNVAGREADLV